MAGITAALTIGSAALGAVGSISQGIAQKKQAEANAQIYDAQARNIAEQQKITAGQYRTKANVLRGEATATAARNGLKISGSTANSISQSIMQLQMDNSYEQYNLATQRQEAYNNAALERYQGKQAYRSGLFNAATTALTAGVDYYGKYWKTPQNSPATWFKGQANKIMSFGKTRLSGGYGATSRQLIQGRNPIV